MLAHHVDLGDGDVVLERQLVLAPARPRAPRCCGRHAASGTSIVCALADRHLVARDLRAVDPEPHGDRRARPAGRCRARGTGCSAARPRMAKRGARSSTMRRSCSPSSPVIERMDRRVEAERGGILRHVGDDAVGDEDARRRSAPAARRRSAWSARRRAAVPSPSGRSAACTSRTSKSPSACSRSFSAATAASVCSVRLPSRWLALSSTTSATTPGSALALLALQHRVGQREHEQRRGERAQRRAAHALPGEHREDEQQQRRRAPRSAARAGADRRRSRGESCLRSLAEPLEQRRHVHLVGLVVAGQRIHHDVDAGAEGELALARIGGHGRVEPEPVRIDRPGGGEVVAGDDDRRNAVAAARRAARILRLRRSGSPPRARNSPSGRETRRADRTPWSARGRAAPARAAARRRRRGSREASRSPACRRRPEVREAAGVARVEEDRAAVLHERVDLRHRLGGGRRLVGVDRPVDQRVEGELVGGDVDRGGLARLERRAVGEIHATGRRVRRGSSSSSSALPVTT